MIHIIQNTPIIGIYKITSPSGKIYIGQSINIHLRWERDYYTLQCKGQPKLYNSLKKYGYEYHTFEIIEECLIEYLNTKERYWQDKFSVLSGNGLNLKLTSTNDRAGKHSFITKQKMSKFWNEYYKNNDGPNRGVKQSKETRLKKSLSAPTHPVFQYDLNGNFIKGWDRIIDVERQLSIANQTITHCCQGTKDSAGGFIWRYQDSHIELLENIKPVKSNKYGISINQYDLKGRFIREWTNMKIAGNELKIDNGSIGNCCKGKSKSAGGFIWKYKIDRESYE
jgi:group I intron endonuclease